MHPPSDSSSIKSSLFHLSLHLAKRNRLTSAAADDMAKMIIQMKRLGIRYRTNSIGDKGAKRLFTLLHEHLCADEQHSHSLETLYLNADGISQNACLAYPNISHTQIAILKPLHRM